MINVLLVALGGAFGSMSRYASSELISYYFRCQKLPYSTLFVNIFGSLLAGIFYYLMTRHLDYFSPKLKNLILIGFLGGFTTFSTFSLDALRLLTAGRYALTFTYILSSIILSITAVFIGFYLTKLGHETLL